MGWIIAAIAALFALPKLAQSFTGLTSASSANGGLSSLGGVPLGGPPQAVGVQATTTANAGTFTAIKTANLALNAIPVVGPALSAVAQALTSWLQAQSQKRAKEAIDENTAVAAAVPGWDQAMYQIQTNYNNGGLSAAQATALVDLAWTNYWQECGPKIQPGRNGCQGGTMSKQQADTQFPGLKQCSGSWGAACCVGYSDLANGAASVKAAIAQTDNNGAPAVANIPAVFGSKYGGANRPQYTLTFVRPSSAFTL